METLKRKSGQAVDVKVREKEESQMALRFPAQ